MSGFSSCQRWTATALSEDYGEATNLVQENPSHHLKQPYFIYEDALQAPMDGQLLVATDPDLSQRPTDDQAPGCPFSYRASRQHTGSKL